MPMYEYGCRSCGHRFEKMLKAEERHAPQSCPVCESDGALLVLSVPGMVGAAASAGPAETCAAPYAGPGGWCCGGGACQN